MDERDIDALGRNGAGAAAALSAVIQARPEATGQAIADDMGRVSPEARLAIQAGLAVAVRATLRCEIDSEFARSMLDDAVEWLREAFGGSDEAN